ncbi:MULTISPECIES: diacylglycerol kinase family protein [Pseudoalteromonas]|uniref:Diacylglycerol kinase n=1 Tax=Pseudoalteromonas amylolytica TaxID=1859457 RepID=A0A1S1MTD6_9GAMM|nr:MULTISPECIES: diacylglycerol kinase family protein [Pseudoalteromonas]MCF6436296.1 dual specificity protein phosphatase family protein [Pseudoalteromonas sp. MMG022]OHU86779.1 hypothetical protein BFC16_14890 [Pseudoalteromonas sp. JW3]OHU88696.1 hypothetical protein BET10_17865 [Pseudoalteromonas amylolytica]
MKMIKYYAVALLLSLGLVWAGRHGWLLIPSVWLSLSLFFILLAYTSNYPKIFRKSATGSIPLWIKILLLPYLAGAQLYNAIVRHNDKVPAIQQITPDLFLACRLFPTDIEMLEAEGVNAIVDVTAEFDGLNWSAEQEGLYYLNIPILDHYSPNETQIIHAINWIKAQHQLKNKVVIHCALGRGRSFFTLCAYLLASQPDLTVREVIEQIQSIRGTARLNKKQLKGLISINNHVIKHAPQELQLIVNPVSGSGKWYQYDNEIIGELTKEYQLNFHFTEKDTDVTNLASSLLEPRSNATTFVACGGDGTVTQVASAIKNTPHTLGIMPTGTANALAHVLLGFNSKVNPITEACEALLAHQTVNMDTMTCNEQTALLVVAVGLEERMIDHANREQKNRLGQLAYIKGFYNALIAHDKLDMTLCVDEQPPEHVECSSIAIANAAPFSTLLAQGGGPPDWQDGLLDITQLNYTDDTSERILSLAELVTNSISQSNSANMSVQHHKAKAVHLSSETEFQYSIDGEIESAKQLSIAVLPQSLSIICADT